MCNQQLLIMVICHLFEINLHQINSNAIKKVFNTHSFIISCLKRQLLLALTLIIELSADMFSTSFRFIKLVLFECSLQKVCGNSAILTEPKQKCVEDIVLLNALILFWPSLIWSEKFGEGSTAIFCHDCSQLAFLNLT